MLNYVFVFVRMTGDPGLKAPGRPDLLSLPPPLLSHDAVDVSMALHVLRNKSIAVLFTDTDTYA